MPFVVIDRIVVDPSWGTKRCTAVGAANEHNLAAGREAGRLDARHHINIVIGACTRTICLEKDLSYQPLGIYRIEVINNAAHVD